MAWSADGASIFFEAVESGTRAGIFRLNLQTRQTIPQAVFTSGRASYPSASPDGSTLFFRRPGVPGLVAKNLKDDTEQALAARPGQFNALSPDGKTFVFLREPGGADSWIIEVMPASGGEQRMVISDVKGTDRVAAWSHDSQYLLFRSGDQVLRVSSAGGAAEPIGLTLPSIKSIAVRPNGNRIAVTGGTTTYALEMWDLARVK